MSIKNRLTATVLSAQARNTSRLLYRYLALPPLFTTDLASERLTGALLDRLTHHVHILEMNGDSYRLKQSKRRARHTVVETQPLDLQQP